MSFGRNLSTSPAARVLFSLLAILMGGAIGLHAQPQGLAERIRSLNDNLLQMHGRTRGAAPAVVRSMRSEASAAIRQRAALMAQLMEQDPGQALALALSNEAVTEISQAFPDSAALLEWQGEWDGPAEFVVADDENLSLAKTFLRMKTADGEMVDLYVADGDVEVQCGDLLQVKGVRLGSRVAAARPMIKVTQALASPCGPAGAQNIAVLLVTFPGVTPPALTAASVQDMLFGTGRSVSEYWRENSYGKTWATGQVFGWFTLDAAYTCDQNYQMRDAAVRAADPSVNFSQFNRLFIIFPKPSGCAWAGLSNVGCSSFSSADGTISASTSWMVGDWMTNNTWGVELPAHEGGHGLGLMHSRSRAFGSDAVGSLTSSGSISEYGDNFSSMGYWNLGHYTVEQKKQLGWMPSSNVTTVQTSGNYTIMPTEMNVAGTQALQVQRGTGNNAYLWLEYRQPTGNYDSQIGSQVFSGALIHYHDNYTGSYTDLADFTGGSSFGDPALPVGTSWTDPYTNLKLTVNSATSSGLNVSVNFGSTPCATAAPLVSVSPSNPSVNAGSSVNYTVTVSNQDSTSCPGTAFSAGSSLPVGFTTSMSPSILTLSPGQSGSVTMTKTVPSGTNAGTYGVNATATGSASGSGSANLTVMAPPPPPPPAATLSAALALSGSSFASKDTVSMTVTATSGSKAASGATVRFTLVEADGGVTTKNATTNSAGSVTWSYRVGPKDPNGPCTVTAQVTYSGQTVTTSPATYAIR